MERRREGGEENGTDEGKEDMWIETEWNEVWEKRRKEEKKNAGMER